MSSNLVDVLTLRAIQKLADTGTLARGTAYCNPEEIRCFSVGNFFV